MTPSNKERKTLEENLAELRNEKSNSDQLLKMSSNENVRGECIWTLKDSAESR